MEKNIYLSEIPDYIPPSRGGGLESVEKIKGSFIELLLKAKQNLNPEDGDKLDYESLPNQRIADEAGVLIQSMYRWFKKGKETIVKVLAADFFAHYQTEIDTFFLNPERLDQPVPELIHDLIEEDNRIFSQYPREIMVLYAPEIPPSTIFFSKRLHTENILSGADFLGKRGLGQRRYLIAQFIVSMFSATRPFRMRSEITGKGQDSNGNEITTVELKFDPDVSKELHHLIVSYLTTYFHPEYFQNFLPENRPRA